MHHNYHRPGSAAIPLRRPPAAGGWLRYLLLVVAVVIITGLVTLQRTYSIYNKRAESTAHDDPVRTAREESLKDKIKNVLETPTPRHSDAKEDGHHIVSPSSSSSPTTTAADKRILFLHPDVVCGASSKPSRLSVVLQGHDDHSKKPLVDLRPPVDLSESVLDTVTNKHPLLWPALDKIAAAEEERHELDEYHVYSDNKRSSNQNKNKKKGQHADGSAEADGTDVNSILPTSGVFCAAVTDERGCPKSMGMLSVGARRGKEMRARDASEFAVFPFRLKSVHSVKDDSRTNSKVTQFASCEAPPPPADGVVHHSTISIQCKVAAATSSSSSSSSSTATAVRAIRLTWPRRVPQENPFFPVVIDDVEMEEGRIRVSQNRAAHGGMVNTTTSAGAVVTALSFNPPKLRLSFLEQRRTQKQKQKKHPRAPPLHLHHAADDDAVGEDDEESEALGVLINGRGVMRMLLSPIVEPVGGDNKKGGNDEDDEVANNKHKSLSLFEPIAYKGEAASGVIHDTILASTTQDQRQTVPLKDFGSVVETAEEFLSAFSDSDSGGSAAASKTVHVKSSIVIHGVDHAACKVKIPAGSLIAAERGVTITFSQCQLTVAGTAQDPVLFVNARRGENWGGLIILAGSSNSARKRNANITHNSNAVNAISHTFIVGTGGAKTSVRDVGTHIKHACPAIVAGPAAAVSLESVYIIGGKGSGITSGKHSAVKIHSSVLFDLAQGGEFVGSSTTIEHTHALHFMLRERHDEFRDEDNDGFYFRDGAANIRDSVIFGSRDDCIDTASSKSNKETPSRLIIENTLLANCQHEGIALSGSVGAAPRSVQLIDSTVKFAQQGIENGHTPSSHSTFLEGVNIEDCGIGIRLGDNYVLDVDGPLEVGSDVALHRCEMPFLNLLREHKQRVWQVDGRQQDPRTVKVHPETVVDGISLSSAPSSRTGSAAGVAAFRTFCGREMFTLLPPDPVNLHDKAQQHEVLMNL